MVNQKIRSLKGIEYFTELTSLYCEMNELTSLDVSGNKKLEILACRGNDLTSLDVSENTALTKLYCCFNMIKYSGMEKLVNSLPNVSSGNFQVYCPYSISPFGSDENVISRDQVATAKAKGWSVKALLKTGGEVDYPGISFDKIGVKIDETNFPDANFRNYLLGQNYGEDAVLEYDEAADVVYLDLSAKNIADLKGIEHFKKLEYLDCGMNQLTSLDISGNTKLKMFGCAANQLTELDLSKNADLGIVNCSLNQLTELDISQNTAMVWLSCTCNRLTSLDVSNNPNLINLECALNYIGYEEMGKLVDGLPTVEDGTFLVYFLGSYEGRTDGNVISKEQVAAAKGKGWQVQYGDGEDGSDYEGMDPDDIDAISVVRTDGESDTEVFDLLGRRLNRPARGLNIIRGKKLLVR